MSCKFKNFLTAVLCCCSLFSTAQTWSQMGTSINSHVRSFAFHNNELYAGGYFWGSGLNRIARWDGAAWLPLGTGTNGTVYAIASYHGKLYVGGNFTIAGGNPASKIACWDGNNWSSVDGGITGNSVYALAVYNDKLYVGGRFTQAGNIQTSAIVAWNDTAWSDVGGGLYQTHATYSDIVSFAVHNGELYAAGYFDSTGTSYCSNNIVSWNGTNWNNVGAGFLYAVNSLCSFQNLLYVGGWFTFTADMHSAKYFVTWDGTGFSNVGGGVDSGVNSIYAYGNKIYLGGYFTLTGTDSIRYIASWDGNSYQDLGNALDSAVWTIIADEGIVYAGGVFTIANGSPANYIAKWSAPGVAVEENYFPQNNAPYPNPSDGLFQFSAPELENSGWVTIYDMNGKMLRRELVYKGRAETDLNGESPGMYFWQLEDEQGNILSKGKMILR